jgi:hypothetical protein
VPVRGRSAGFFIPNDSKKYSVGENAGTKLNVREGIAIHDFRSLPSLH